MSGRDDTRSASGQRAALEGAADEVAYLNWLDTLHDDALAARGWRRDGTGALSLVVCEWCDVAATERSVAECGWCYAPLCEVCQSSDRHRCDREYSGPGLM